MQACACHVRRFGSAFTCNFIGLRCSSETRCPQDVPLLFPWSRMLRNLCNLCIYVLYCTVLYCTALCCSVLYCAVVYCIVLLGIRYLIFYHQSSNIMPKKSDSSHSKLHLKVIFVHLASSGDPTRKTGMCETGKRLKKCGWKFQLDRFLSWPVPMSAVSVLWQIHKERWYEYKMKHINIWTVCQNIIPYVCNIL